MLQVILAIKSRVQLGGFISRYARGPGSGRAPSGIQHGELRPALLSPSRPKLPCPPAAGELPAREASDWGLRSPLPQTSVPAGCRRLGPFGPLPHFRDEETESKDVEESYSKTLKKTQTQRL